MPAFLSSVKLGIHSLLALDARANAAGGKPDGPQRDSCSGNLEHGLASVVGGVLSGWELSGSGMQRQNNDCTIRMWDVRTGSPVAGPFQGHTNLVLLVLFSPNSKHIVSGSQDKTVCIWSAVNGTLLCGPLHSHTGLVHSVTYLPDSTLIASASFDKTIQLWRLDNGTPAASPLQGHTSYVYSVVFSPDGTLLVSGSEDMTVCVWRVSDGWLSPLRFRAIQVASTWWQCWLMAHLLSLALMMVLCEWRIADGSLAAGPFVGHTEFICVECARGIVAPASSDHALPKIRSLSFSPNNDHVLTELDEGEVQMWDVSNGTSHLAPPNIQLPRPPSITTSPDSSHTAQTNSDGELVQVVRTNNKTVAAGSFDPAA
ncbi:hypothetical protein RHS01_11191 [Rhizoctonia solani]|uniref:WD40 repeat-like protein n=1 Tax=Rhizoctonia solani TaxID=456999 RepID=A0A8H7I217_9AGAM|nr:hypothetical protein RHS01_11191 [Rhizoctonia solani]